MDRKECPNCGARMVSCGECGGELCPRCDDIAGDWAAMGLCDACGAAAWGM